MPKPAQLLGTIRHQAHTEQQHSAQQSFKQSSDGDYSLWVQQQGLTLRTAQSHSTRVTGGDLQLQVKSGALITQVNGDITIKGNGGGDILLTDGTGGIKIDSSGHIKLFGKKVTLHGRQSGVVFSGDVSYETGGGNEVESAGALSAAELAETTILDLSPYESDGDSLQRYERIVTQTFLIRVLS